MTRNDNFISHSHFSIGHKAGQNEINSEFSVTNDTMVIMADREMPLVSADF